MKVTVIPLVIDVLGTVTTRGLGNSIVAICSNSKKRPGDIKRLAVTQTSVVNNQLTLV